MSFGVSETVSNNLSFVFINILNLKGETGPTGQIGHIGPMGLHGLRGPSVFRNFT